MSDSVVRRCRGAELKAMLGNTSWRQRTLLLSALLIPLVLATWFSAHLRSRTISEAEQNAQRSVVALEQHAANVIDTHSLILNQLDTLSRGRAFDQLKNDAQLRAILSGLSDDFTQVSTIGITDADGRVVTNSIDVTADGLSVADRDYFVAHKTGGFAGLFISKPLTGRSSGARQFALSIRRTLPSGKFGGVIFTAVPLEHFTDFWKDFTPSDRYLIPLIRPDGALLVRYPRTDSPGQLDPKGPFVTHLTRSPKGIYTAVSLVDGIERINAYSQVKRYPLFISFSVETAAVLQDWRRQVLAAALVATVMAGLLVALWLLAVRQTYRQALSIAQLEATASALKGEIARRQQAEESMRQGVARITFEEQLIGIVSHDLRNPLNTISLNAAVMARCEDLGAQEAQCVQRIKNGADRAARLVTDLLDFTQARLGGRIPITPKPTDLHELLQGILAELEAAHHGRITSTLAADRSQGVWDADRLAQVVENLVVNALKYGARDGIVHISTRSDDGWLFLTVYNQGESIPRDKIGLIFEPLQRAGHEAHTDLSRSIGMGLYIVKHIVEAHRGQIHVESEPGQGTTFTVRLPFNL